MASSPALPSFDVLYNRIVTDNPGHVVSTSWGICEEFWFEEEGLALSPVDENILANAAAIGQSWFAASGDSSILECPSPVVGAPFAPGALFPASSAYVVGVGGTSVFQCNTPNSSSGLFGTSYVPWDCNAYRPARGPLGSPTAVGPSEIPWALSGTGDSILVGQPLWQVGCGIQQIAGTRMVPDVSLLSDPSFPGYVVRHGGSWIGVGGTSAAAPQWGAFAAEEGQLAGGSLGLVGPRLYELCDTPALHAITTPGYAQPTGLGTPDVRALLGAYLGPSLTETQPYVVGNQGVTSFCSESLGLGSNCDALNECVGAAGENSQAACFYVAGQPRVALSAADDSGLTQSIQYQFYDPTISVVANGTVCGRGDIPVPPTAVLAQVSVGPLALAPDCLATLATAGTISLSN
jgi:subtilase family serine protease